MNIKVFTDGSSLGNPGRGGWAYAIVNDSNELITEFSGNEPKVTNNLMELKAFAFGLIKALELPQTTSIEIYSDSQYVVNSIKMKWAENWVRTHQIKRPNYAEWETLLKWFTYAKSHNIPINVVWVKGHADNEWNNRVDELARTEAGKL